jgi:hypothetical protein
MIPFALLLAERPANGQVLDRMREAARERIDARKIATEDNLVLHAALVGDSLAALGLAPVDSLVGSAASAITFAATRAGGSDGTGERARLDEALRAGRADLVDVFTIGTVEPSEAGQELLQTLATLVAERAEPVLLEAFADAVEPGDPLPGLGERRVRLARALLVGYGRPATLVFAVTDGDPGGAASEAGAPVQLRVRPLR